MAKSEARFICGACDAPMHAEALFNDGDEIVCDGCGWSFIVHDATPQQEPETAYTKRGRFCNKGGCPDSWHVGGNYGSEVCRNPEHHDPPVNDGQVDSSAQQEPEGDGWEITAEDLIACARSRDANHGRDPLGHACRTLRDRLRARVQPRRVSDEAFATTVSLVSPRRLELVRPPGTRWDEGEPVFVQRALPITPEEEDDRG